jgi:hypothetical protein
MEIINFKYTWCDYLTKCKHFPNIEVGSYECACCLHCVRIKLDEKPEYKTCDMKQYFDTYNGIVECNKF